MRPTKFNPKLSQLFSFDGYKYSRLTSTAHLYYSLDGIRFEELYTFIGAGAPNSPEQELALDVALRHLHLVAGISYYKASVPKRIEIGTYSIPPETSHYLRQLYINGLGEFSFKTGVDIDHITFPSHAAKGNSATDVTFKNCTAIPVGGGKDSIVTIESLKRLSEPLVLFSIGNTPAIRQTCSVAGLPHIIVKRRLDPMIVKLNAAGAYNGHVPISAIIAHCLLVAAILYGFHSAALSNERSANVGNMLYQGKEINHQYSKSLQFEQMFSSYVKCNILSTFEYFSYLRPLSEIGISRLFSTFPEYHDVFVSCNSHYRIHEAQHRQRWCGNCPKCRFVFLSLAPFLEKERLLNIFGSNLLDDSKQIVGFDNLLCLNGSYKPFECVGETEECVAAFSLLAESPKWRNDKLVSRFATELAASFPTKLAVRNSLSFASANNMPTHFEKHLYEHYTTCQL